MHKNKVLGSPLIPGLRQKDRGSSLIRRSLPKQILMKKRGSESDRVFSGDKTWERSRPSFLAKTGDILHAHVTEWGSAIIFDVKTSEVLGWIWFPSCNAFLIQLKKELLFFSKVQLHGAVAA